MIDEETKTELLARAFELYRDQSWDELMDLFDDSIVWHDGHSHGDHTAEEASHDERRDYTGKNEVKAHLQECWDHVYKIPGDRQVESEGVDWATASDVVERHPGRCMDLYRFGQSSDGNWKIVECWTCLNHPMEERLRLTSA